MDRWHQRIDEKIVELPLPQITGDIEVVRMIPQERVQQRIDKQFVDVPLPQTMEETVEEVQN